MIGNLMSEAAHSIIGMFSARSAGMESKASNSDFGSLLLSSEKQPQFGGAEVEIDISEIEVETLDISDTESLDVGDQDAVPVQQWETTSVLPLINQSLGGTIFHQERSFADNGQDETVSDPVVSDSAKEKLSLTFNRDALQNIRSTPFAADGEARQAKARLALDALTPQAKPLPGGSLPIDIAPKSGDADLVDGQPFSDPANQLELNKQTAASAHLGVKAGEQKDARAEPGKFSFPALANDTSPVATTSLQKTTIADTDFLELAKLDVQPAVKRFEQSMEQLPLANSSAQLAVRENIQKSTSFDMSSPQVAERLGAEIAEISVNGGTKKFEINPRNLGRMEIILTTRGSTEIIEIQTEHQAAKHIIAQHSQALQDILKSQGRDDLTLRVEVKDIMFSSSNPEGGNLSRQENGDSREQQARPSQNRQIAQSLDGALENDSASDRNRYA
ncbi:flagellar hook-length control protein FliK [uncultured Parasphingorhabdus sp.]|uniref:flagellar hook-length control protein FliK n=1 Tax=uncultured Parasphingorhabdus sp. TaxID=2709694 RepID=UPI0030DAD83F|tara:strand:+ start:80641 stop:81981 length:1341 start_codon:yes stop_codon:yes gene_type:complete